MWPVVSLLSLTFIFLPFCASAIFGAVAGVGSIHGNVKLLHSENDPGTEPVLWAQSFSVLEKVTDCYDGERVSKQTVLTIFGDVVSSSNATIAIGRRSFIFFCSCCWRVGCTHQQQLRHNTRAG